jgi:hypothetical protein
VPAEAPVERVPAEALTEAPAEHAAAEEPAEHVPAEAPAEHVLAEAPFEDVPAEAPTEAPAEHVAVEPPVKPPAKAPAEHVPADEALLAEEPFPSVGRLKKGRERKAQYTGTPDPPSHSIDAERQESNPLSNTSVLNGNIYQPPRRTSIIQDETPCAWRGYHLANESLWMKCQKCRGELNTLAQQIVAKNPGWDFT